MQYRKPPRDEKPLKLNETINATAYLHHNKDCDGNYYKEQELDITIYTVK